MDGSALRTVFGSTASLAELSGDSTSTEPSRTGYSRFGLNEHPPAHQMHTKVRRLSTASKGDKPVRALGHPFSWYTKSAILLAFGVLQSLLMHTHLPLAVEPSDRQRIELLVVGSVLVLFAGLAVPATEASDPEVAVAANPANTTRPEGDKRNWKTDVMRSYGALLGLLYLSEKLPRDGITAWVIIVPSIWYISDTTLNGLGVGSLVAVAGSLATFYEFPALRHAAGAEMLAAAAGTAAAYFGTSLVAGNVGRGLELGH